MYLKKLGKMSQWAWECLHYGDHGGIRRFSDDLGELFEEGYLSSTAWIMGVVHENMDLCVYFDTHAELDEEQMYVYEVSEVERFTASATDQVFNINTIPKDCNGNHY